MNLPEIKPQLIYFKTIVNILLDNRDLNAPKLVSNTFNDFVWMLDGLAPK